MKKKRIKGKKSRKRVTGCRARDPSWIPDRRPVPENERGAPGEAEASRESRTSSSGASSSHLWLNELWTVEPGLCWLPGLARLSWNRQRRVFNRQKRQTAAETATASSCHGRLGVKHAASRTTVKVTGVRRGPGQERDRDSNEGDATREKTGRVENAQEEGRSRLRRARGAKTTKRTNERRTMTMMKRPEKGRENRCNTAA